MRVADYSDFISGVAALIGVQVTDLQTPELAILNAGLNKSLRKAWESNNWPDLCPYGEVRFPINLVAYPNDVTQPTWNTQNVTVTAAAINNPLDNRVTASQIMETAATGFHGFSEVFTVLPNAGYSASGYCRPNGRTNIQVTLSDGSTSWSSFFNLATGAVGTSSGSGVMAGIQQQANGFFYWNLSVTSSPGANNSGSVTIDLSPDGVTTNYAGSSNLGVFSWGVTCSAPSTQIPASYYIPWEQAGESAIDVMFESWSSDPGSFLPAYRLDYAITNNGIEYIGPTSTGPIYLHYRQRRPIFTGAAWSSSVAYAFGSQFFFTATAANAYGNFPSNYFTVAAPLGTSAGQSPSTNPALFSQVNFPYIFLEYCVQASYADWLEVEGQSAKAQALRGFAQDFLDAETDRMERQQGVIMPWKVYTHLTSQNRGLGYVGQNFNAGTATID